MIKRFALTEMGSTRTDSFALILMAYSINSLLSWRIDRLVDPPNFQHVLVANLNAQRKVDLATLLKITSLWQ